MHSPSSVSPADIKLDDETLAQLVQHTEEQALSEAAESEGRVDDVQKIQKEKVRAMLTGSVEAEGQEPSEALEPVLDQADEAIDKEHEKRMQTIQETPDAYVLERTDETAGVQHDDTREVGIAEDVLQDETAAEKVSRHEGEHLKQEEGSQVVEIPKTGDAALDQEGGKMQRIAFRESGAIDAEGGLSNHTEEYHDFVETAEAAAAFIDEHGEQKNGQQLMEEAGKSVEGFQKLHAAVVSASVRKALKERMHAVAA